MSEFVEGMGFKRHKLHDVTEDSKREIENKLCTRVLEALSESTVIMSTGPVAAVLLEYRKGITNEAMIKQVEYIYGELEARNTSTAEHTAQNRGTTNAMNLLTEFVKKKRDIFEPFVSPKVDYKNILMLAYYKNTIVHVFLKEMIIGRNSFNFSCFVAWVWKRHYQGYRNHKGKSLGESTISF